jgi:hypothetical protein
MLHRPDASWAGCCGRQTGGDEQREEKRGSNYLPAATVQARNDHEGEVLHDTQLDDLIGQKTQAPRAPALRGFGASDSDELCFLLPVEFAFVFAVRGLALDAAGEAALTEAPSDPCDRSFGYFQGFSRAAVRPGRAFRPFVYFQQNANARLLSCRTLPAPQAFEEMGALVFGQFETVFLVGDGIWKRRLFNTGLLTTYHTKITDSRLTAHWISESIPLLCDPVYLHSTSLLLPSPGCW